MLATQPRTCEELEYCIANCFRISFSYIYLSVAINKCMRIFELQKPKTPEQLKLDRVITLTYENGKEFAGHGQINEQLQSTAYFARPFAGRERGNNENLNGLLRQYIPKKRSMSTVTDEEIRMIQNRLNNRPRKRLEFKTPAEVFHQSLKRIALHT